MKFKAFAFLAILISYGAFAQEQTPQEFNLNSKQDTLQYAIGAFIGQWMVNNNLKVTNANIFLSGMDAALNNKPLAVADTSIAPIVAAYQLSAQIDRSKLLEEQLFASLRGKAGFGVLPSGVHYLIIENGQGNRPNSSNTIVFHAKGVFPDGTVFEDTYQQEQPISNVLSNLIPGLNEAIQLMPVGSTWRIFIPSALAYGSVGIPGQVPPFTALVFDIQLIEIKE